MWLDSLFKVIGTALGIYKQNTDPEVERLNKLFVIEEQLTKERKNLDDLLAFDKANPIDFGICINRIISLRKQKDNLKK